MMTVKDIKNVLSQYDDDVEVMGEWIGNDGNGSILPFEYAYEICKYDENGKKIGTDKVVLF